MKILGIEHIGIATEGEGQAAHFWETVLGITRSGLEEVASQKVRTTIYRTEKGKIELLSPTDPTSTIQKFLTKRGPGIHHICLEVENIEVAIKELKEKNIPLINEEPVTGAEGYRIVFIHPRGTGGVLVELAQKS